MLLVASLLIVAPGLAAASVPSYWQRGGLEPAGGGAPQHGGGRLVRSEAPSAQARAQAAPAGPAPVKQAVLLDAQGVSANAGTAGTAATPTTIELGDFGGKGAALPEAFLDGKAKSAEAPSEQDWAHSWAASKPAIAGAAGAGAGAGAVVKSDDYTGPARVELMPAAGKSATAADLVLDDDAKSDDFVLDEGGAGDLVLDTDEDDGAAEGGDTTTVPAKIELLPKKSWTTPSTTAGPKPEHEHWHSRHGHHHHHHHHHHLHHLKHHIKHHLQHQFKNINNHFATTFKPETTVVATTFAPMQHAPHHAPPHLVPHFNGTHWNLKVPEPHEVAIWNGTHWAKHTHHFNGTHTITITHHFNGTHWVMDLPKPGDPWSNAHMSGHAIWVPPSPHATEAHWNGTHWIGKVTYATTTLPLINSTNSTLGTETIPPIVGIIPMPGPSSNVTAKNGTTTGNWTEEERARWRALHSTTTVEETTPPNLYMDEVRGGATLPLASASIGTIVITVPVAAQNGSTVMVRKGIDGRPGKRGPIGTAGSQGMKGMIGPRGLQGDMGPRGPVGPPGPDGRFAWSIMPAEVGVWALPVLLMGNIGFVFAVSALLWNQHIRGFGKKKDPYGEEGAEPGAGEEVPAEEGAAEGGGAEAEQPPAAGAPGSL